MLLSRIGLIVAPALVAGLPASTRSGKVLFFLAGDSTTAVNGGWGDGLLANLICPASGLNVGKSGATTLSFVQGSYWKNVTDHVTETAASNDVYVTISVRKDYF
jgi:hypothetical protein